MNKIIIKINLQSVIIGNIFLVVIKTKKALKYEKFKLFSILVFLAHSYNVKLMQCFIWNVNCSYYVTNSANTFYNFTHCTYKAIVITVTNLIVSNFVNIYIRYILLFNFIFIFILLMMFLNLIF